jgi:hypothetical protein
VTQDRPKKDPRTLLRELHFWKKMDQDEEPGRLDEKKEKMNFLTLAGKVIN